jgi:hypothetical protein
MGTIGGMKRLTPALAAMALVLAFVAAFGGSIARADDHMTFYGIVEHVSADNIKVEDPKTKQTLSFVLLPKFDQVFSANGKTTYQMADIKAGNYVAVVYDQKALGVRHADKIYKLNNANERISTM